ncbi:MAG: NAD(P)/FAD-dependent oxidoreductase [Crocinitomicaceae bacterium]|nr:NAD(P)/FAD-dependent oxidoreductase [Crocinitomicaceae bacterium]MBK8926978.1 NAD(P)/FAD-dependent oxidoreductase [Crocinitomicaceae bacterium]
MITTDIIVIGAGPAGLFTVFEAGLLKLRCHLIDSLPQPGGQLKEIYPKKPIYDIPGFPIVNAGELVDRLMEQIAPFKPGFTLGESAQKIDEREDGNFIVTTNLGTQHKAPVIIIAGGLGVFEPRKPPVDKLEFFENKGVEYMVRDPQIYQNKKMVIAGGGDSALDWSIYLAENNIPSHITLVHRNNSFRGHLDSVQKVMDLSAAGKINLITEAEVISMDGDSHLKSVTIKHATQGEFQLSADHFVPLFGLKPSLGPMAEWGLEIDKGSLVVNTKDYSTNRKGIFAVGDINTYDGKLKLILCGFHEATLAVQAAFARIYPDKKQVLKYTTVNGINGF